MKNSEKRKKLEKKFRKASNVFLKVMAEFYKEADGLPIKSLKKLMKNIERQFLDDSQEIAQRLSNLDYKVNPQPKYHELPNTSGKADDLPF